MRPAGDAELAALQLELWENVSAPYRIDQYLSGRSLTRLRRTDPTLFRRLAQRQVLHRLHVRQRQLHALRGGRRVRRGRLASACPRALFLPRRWRGRGAGLPKGPRGTSDTGDVATGGAARVCTARRHSQFRYVCRRPRQTQA